MTISQLDKDLDVSLWPVQGLSEQYRSAIAALVEAHLSDLEELRSDMEQARGQGLEGEFLDVYVPVLSEFSFLPPSPGEHNDTVRVARAKSPELINSSFGPRLDLGGMKLASIESREQPLDECCDEESERGVPFVGSLKGVAADEGDDRSTQMSNSDMQDADHVKKNIPVTNKAIFDIRAGRSSKRVSIRTPSCEMMLDQSQTWADQSTVEEIRRHSAAYSEELSDLSYSTTEMPHNSSALHRLQKIVAHPYFEFVTGLLIGTNAIFVGFQTNFDLINPHRNPPSGFKIVNHMYTIAFFIDLAMRWVAAGFLRFLWSRQWAWNYLDIFVVFCSVIEAVMELFLSGRMNNFRGLRLMRFIRMARLARVLRLGRLLTLFRALRVLVFSILITLKTVFWAVLLLVMMIYMFSLVLAQNVGEYLREEDRVPVDVLTYWGSVPKVMMTLFESIMGGLSWHVCVSPLGEVTQSGVIIFLAYICLATLAVLNVITGVFCESAIEGAKQDRDLMVQKHMAKKKDYVTAVRNLFKEIDTDKSNNISLIELADHLGDDASKAFFASLEIDIGTVWEIFELLDMDREGSIGIDDFISGCLRLRGQATSLELARLQEAIKRCDNMMMQIFEHVTGSLPTLEGNISRHKAPRNHSYNLRRSLAGTHY